MKMNKEQIALLITFGITMALSLGIIAYMVQQMIKIQGW